jgi:glutamyl-tRNA synthetase
LLLRIEDIDSPRIKAGAFDQILRDLEWLGLDWDSGPFIQTERQRLHEEALGKLQVRELVYPCTCTRSDIERAASAPHPEHEHEGPAYPGTCSNRRTADAQVLEGHPFAWRFRLPGVIPEFDDVLAGRMRTDLHRIGGDFVVWKSAGTPAYQLAVVVDDAALGVTEVIRGSDLLTSTPRQLLIYLALDLKPPTFTHVPLVVGPDGRRLAKRHGDTRLEALRAAGVAPEMLIGLLAWSCGWQEEITPISAQELLPLFRPETIPRKPFVLTPELLGRIGYATV